MILTTLAFVAALSGQVCPVDAGCVCACATRDSGVHADAAPVPPDTGIWPDAAPADVGFADTGVAPDARPDSGVFPDATPADTGIHADAQVPDGGVALGSLASVNRAATWTSPSPLGSGQCAAAPGSVVPGLVNLSVVVQGVTRTALVSLPPSVLFGGPLPVVLALHGATWQGPAFRGSTVNGVFTWTDPQIERNLQLVTPDDTDGSIMVFPNGLTGGPCGASTGWDLGNGGQTRDVEFMDAILTWLGQRYCLDARRIYAYGRSCGGAMIYELVGRRPTVFAAALVVNGYRNFGLYPGDVGYPASNLLVVHGSADTTVPISIAAAIASALPSRNGTSCTVTTRTNLANITTCTLTACSLGESQYCVTPNQGHFPPVPLTVNETIPWFARHARQ